MDPIFYPIKGASRSWINQLLTIFQGVHITCFNCYATLFTLQHFHYFTTTYKSFALAKFGGKNKLKNLFMAKQVEMPCYIFCHFTWQKNNLQFKSTFCRGKNVDSQNVNENLVCRRNWPILGPSISRQSSIKLKSVTEQHIFNYTAQLPHNSFSLLLNFYFNSGQCMHKGQ